MKSDKTIKIVLDICRLKQERDFQQIIEKLNWVKQSISIFFRLWVTIKVYIF